MSDGRGLCKAEGCVELRAPRVQYCERHRDLRNVEGQRAFDERQARRRKPVIDVGFESALERGDFAGALRCVERLDAEARASAVELDRLIMQAVQS